MPGRFSCISWFTSILYYSIKVWCSIVAYCVARSFVLLLHYIITDVFGIFPGRYYWVFKRMRFSLSRGLLFRIFTWDNSFHLSPYRMPLTNGRKHCWPTAPNIVGCYMLGPFARPCCTLLSVVGSCCPKLEIVQTFSYVKTDATTPNDIVGRCYVCLQVVLDILLSKGSR